jgi:hemolysin activation/secretion protein
MIEASLMNLSLSWHRLHARSASLLMAGYALTLAMPWDVNAAEIEAGTLQQQIDRNQTFKLPRQALPLLPKPLEKKPDTGLKILVKSLKLQGNTLLPEAQIKALLDLYQNKEMSFVEIENVVIEVAELFRKEGWTVKAYLPEQDVKDGQILIQIVEARLGKVLIDGAIAAPATLDSLTSIIQNRQAIGDYLSGSAIDRALLIANDISGVYVTGNLTEGSADSETDVVLKITSKPFIDGNATFDNTGSRGTGVKRTAVNTNFNNMGQPGDQLSGNMIQTEASEYARLGWKVPVGHDGWTVGASISHMTYRALQFQETVAPTGSSGTRGIEGIYPLIRSRSQNLYVSIALEQKQFLNNSEGEVKSEYATRLRTLSFYGNSFDQFGGGGANTASLTFVNGFLNLDNSPNASEVATTTQTAGVFNKIRYAANRQQVITPELSFIGSISGQVSQGGKNLDSSEKFFLGGSSGLRAYPSSEAGGGNGVLANLELRWQFSPDFTLSGFYDVGRVVMFPSKNLQDVTALNAYSLRGRGFSVAWQGDEGVTVKLIVARRIGSNPNANIETGKDLDGSLVRNRAWISLNIPY